MITKDDVNQVAYSLKINLTESQVEQVILLYQSYENSDCGATWDLIVEQIIYDIK